MTDIWGNQYTSLFVVGDDIIHLAQANVFRLEIREDKLFVILEELMPSQFVAHADFDSLLNFEVTHATCGIRSDYCADDVIIKISGCRLVKKWMDGIIALRRDDAQMLSIYAEFKCDEIELTGGAI